jgi:hypothetical protein
VPPPFITFLSDYGLVDEFVGICHGVIATICPEARVIDLTHGVPRHNVRAGGLILRGALPYMPAGVHLAVVDPDVGAARRAVALRLGDGRLLVGPDNGLLWLAAEAGGGVVEAVDIARSPFRLEPVSATTSSPRWRPSWPPGRRWRRSESRPTRTSWNGSSCRDHAFSTTACSWRTRSTSTGSGTCS